MKILQVIPYFYPAWRFGGPVKVAYDISKLLVKRGHSVTVYTTDIKDETSRIEAPYIEVEGVNVFYFKNLSVSLAKRKLFITPSSIVALGKNLKYFDVVHVHGIRTTQGPVFHHFLKREHVPYVLQAHGGIPMIGGDSYKRLFDVLFGYRLLHDASRVIALHKIEAEQYRRMGVPEEKIAIIPNGIDLAEYANLPPKGCFKRKFGIPAEKKIILYLGRIHKTKGIDFLIKTYAHLTKKMGIKGTVLVIAGPDDGYLGELKQLANFLKITDNLLFTGILSEKEKISAYVDASVVVNVEPKNVFGLVPLEAAACSTPVIVSKTNAISRIIKAGNFGFSANYGDVPNLASKLYGILNDVGLAEKLGKNGRKYVFNHFGWDNIIKVFERVYEETVEENA